MHPNRGFDWTDEGEMLAFVARNAFATIALPTPGVIHLPLVVDGRAIRFHLSRRNRLAGAIDGQRLVASVVGRHGYQSANWYVSDNQVPTWHYEAVEIEGVARQLDEEGLSRQVDALSDAMEAIYQPQRPWTRAKMDPGRYESMLKGIVGFELPIEAIRGTRKFNQHKAPADIDATVAGLRLAGMDDVADAVDELRPRSKKR